MKGGHACEKRGSLTCENRHGLLPRPMRLVGQVRAWSAATGRYTHPWGDIETRLGMRRALAVRAKRCRRASKVIQAGDLPDIIAAEGVACTLQVVELAAASRFGCHRRCGRGGGRWCSGYANAGDELKARTAVRAAVAIGAEGRLAVEVAEAVGFGDRVTTHRLTGAMQIVELTASNAFRPGGGRRGCRAREIPARTPLAGRITVLCVEERARRLQG